MAASSSSFAQEIQNSVTATTAVSDLTSLVADFAGASAKEKQAVRAKHFKSTGAETVLQHLEDAMTKAKSYCAGAFRAQFSAAPTGTDSGVVLNYSSAGNLQNVVSRIEANFSSWGITLSSGALQGLANAIAPNVSAALGKVDSSFGSFTVDSNTVINWAVTHGTFAQTDDGELALVFAFSAAKAGGSGKKLAA